jgi:hypothetical protein
VPVAVPVGATTASPPTAVPVAPVAAPVAQPVPQTGASFAFDEETPRTRRGKSRRRGGPWWKGPAILASVLLVAGIATAAMWKHIQPLFNEAKEAISQNTKKDKEAAPAPDNKNTGKPPRKRPKAGPNKRPMEEDPEPVALTGGYPRRALIISIHDYLYANPLQEFDKHESNLDGIKRALNVSLRVPYNQVFHLSDRAKKQQRPPMKPIIEKTLTSFLDTSRPQDRILVFFIGHSVQIEDKAYLVPLEGELDDAKTLIPLQWVYDKLAVCKARQKVLVFDGNRFNPGQGLERPGSGPMGAAVAKMLLAPPAGVQVWSSCSAGQTSYADDYYPIGAFLDHVRTSLMGTEKRKGVLEGRIPKPDDLIPVETIHEAANKMMAEDLQKRGVKQVARLSGSAPARGAPYDKAEAPAAKPTIPTPESGGAEVVKALLDEINVPPMKPGQDAMSLNFTSLPPFPPDVLKKYDKTGDPESPLRKAVHKARITLWAVSTASTPTELQAEVTAVRAKIRVDLSVMKESYNAPGGGNAEKVFKDKVTSDGTAMARIVFRLQEALDELKEAGKMRGAEPPRWQANYDFILARLQAQMAYLEEYQALLGLMRKELPPLDRNLYTGWRLASTVTMQGGREATKYSKPSRTLLDRLAKANAGTPWEVLAKREKLTALGLEWQPAK